MDKRAFRFSLPDLFAAMAAIATALVPFVYFSFGAALALLGCVALGVHALRRPVRFLMAASLFAFAVGVGVLLSNSNGGPAEGTVLLAPLVLAAASRQIAKKRALVHFD
ncbi:MAG TPA: hypothetical protein VHC22_17085 [Pirellulales bacterium]|nr:hypothetical protein [Pirellulales bacterium]